MRTRILASLAIASLAGPLTASALVVDFEGLPDNFDPVQTVDGFTFAFSASGWAVIQDSFDLPGFTFTRNGTTRLVAAGDRDDVTAQVVMSQGGTPFSLFNLDAATFFADIGNGEMEIIGSLADGGTISTTFDLFPSFNSVPLSGFEGLSSVLFRTTISAGFGSEPGFSIDNLDVDEGPRVPEPGALALLSLGLAGLGVTRRRRTH